MVPYMLLTTISTGTRCWSLDQEGGHDRGGQVIKSGFQVCDVLSRISRV